MRTSQKTPETITTIGIDLGKNTFHLVGLDKRGAIVLQQKVSRGQLGRRLSNIPRCLIGMEACSGSHHIGRQLAALGHDVRLGVWNLASGSTVEQEGTQLQANEWISA
jgi:hypothetical protein